MIVISTCKDCEAVEKWKEGHESKEPLFKSEEQKRKELNERIDFWREYHDEDD